MVFQKWKNVEKEDEEKEFVLRAARGLPAHSISQNIAKRVTWDIAGRVALYVA